MAVGLKNWVRGTLFPGPGPRFVQNAQFPKTHPAPFCAFYTNRKKIKKLSKNLLTNKKEYAIIMMSSRERATKKIFYIPKGKTK
jgi:hypothetical protein